MVANGKADGKAKANSTNKVGFRTIIIPKMYDSSHGSVVKIFVCFQSKVSPDWICIMISPYILQSPSLNYSKVFISCGNLQHTTHLRLILGLLCQPPILRRVCNCGEPCGRVVPNEKDSKRMPQRVRGHCEPTARGG